MACPYIRNELKCKFPPCPCKKCVALRAERVAGGFCGLPPDTPPESPTYECRDNRDKSKCDCKLKVIGPPYKRKYSPTREKHKKSSDNKESDLEEGEACNKNCNLSTFIINIISFIALVITAVIVFWLKMCYWTFILGAHLYNSNRTIQMTVLSIFGILILCMCCTYAMGSSKRDAKELSAAPKCNGPHCDAKANIADDEARKIYKQSKLYSISMDMKQPPALLVYLRSFIFEAE